MKQILDNHMKKKKQLEEQRFNTQSSNPYHTESNVCMNGLMRHCWKESTSLYLVTYIIP